MQPAASQVVSRNRWWVAAPRICVLLVLVLACVAVGLASAQEVAPRQTGAMVVGELAKARAAVDARARASGDAKLQALAAKLAAMGAMVQKSLGGDADEPVATIGADERDMVVRAGAAAKRTQAWLAATAVACTKDDIAAMLAALTTALDQLAADSQSQKADLPIIDGVETLDKRPLFVVHAGSEAPRFVLTGANLVDAKCANPGVLATDAQGRPAAVQPKLVAAQPTRVEVQWPDADKLPAGSYVLHLTTQRKAFLVGCVSQPPAVATLAIEPPLHFTVHWALVASCTGAAAPVTLGGGTIDVAGRGQTVARAVDLAACATPTSYTVTAAARAGNGQETRMGPITQGPDAGITAGLGNGLTLSWDPALHQVFVRSGTRTCAGVY